MLGVGKVKMSSLMCWMTTAREREGGEVRAGQLARARSSRKATLREARTDDVAQRCLAGVRVTPSCSYPGLPDEVGEDDHLLEDERRREVAEELVLGLRGLRAGD